MMNTYPIYLPRRTFRNKKVNRQGVISLKIHVLAATGIVIGLSAASFEIDWGDGTWDTDLIHTYENTGVYLVHIYGIEINELNVSRCCIKEIDLSACPWLEYLTISFNALKKLDVSACLCLNFLNCSDCMIEELVLGNHLPELFYLNCSHNLLNELILPPVCNLYCLIAHHNELVQLNLASCSALRCIDIAYNALPLMELQAALESAPVVAAEEMACIMYEMNPSSFEIDEEKIRAKGWKLQVS